MGNLKTYCFDIDGTICSNTEGDYANAQPHKKRIDNINELYDLGNKIIYYTARGSTTNKDWKELTTKQFIDWGVKYDELCFGKPTADIYIDDKHKDIFSWFN